MDRCSDCIEEGDTTTTTTMKSKDTETSIDALATIIASLIYLFFANNPEPNLTIDRQ